MYLRLAAEPYHLRVSGGTGFEIMTVSWTTAGAWHREGPGEATVESAAQLQQKIPQFGDDHQEQQQLWSGVSGSLEGSCVCCEGSAGEMTQVLGGAQKIMSATQTLDIELFTCWSVVLL